MSKETGCALAGTFLTIIGLKDQGMIQAKVSINTTNGTFINQFALTKI